MTKYRIVARRSGDPVIGYIWFARVQKRHWWWGWESIPGTVQVHREQKSAVSLARHAFMNSHNLRVVDIVVLG